MSDHGHHAVVVPAPGPEFKDHVVAHHFDTPEQEFQALKLGFWLFLATEILLFGGLFAAYFYFHEVYPETFRQGGRQLDWKLGSLNTSVLLISSWTMAMGVRSAQTNQRKKTMMFLALTVLGAAGFMSIKFIEYQSKFHHGTLPVLVGFYELLEWTMKDSGRQIMLFGTLALAVGLLGSLFIELPKKRLVQLVMAVAAVGLFTALAIMFHGDASYASEAGGFYDHQTGVLHWFTDHDHKMADVPHGPLFFAIYFTMTGIHGLHVLIGAGLIIWIMTGVKKGRFHSGYYLPVDLVGLYWHLVDLIWIFLFPLLYLVP